MSTARPRVESGEKTGPRKYVDAVLGRARRRLQWVARTRTVTYMAGEEVNKRTSTRRSEEGAKETIPTTNNLLVGSVGALFHCAHPRTFCH